MVSRSLALLAGCALLLPAVVASTSFAQSDDLPTDQPRRVVFEFFAKPTTSSGGG